MTAPIRPDPLSPDEFRRQKLSPKAFRAKRRGVPSVRPDASYVDEPSEPHGPLHEMRMASEDAPTLSVPTRQSVEHERRARGRSGIENFARGVAKRGAETVPATMQGFARLIGDEEGARRFAASRERMAILDPQGSAGQAGELVGAILGEGAAAGVAGHATVPRLIARARTPLGRAGATILPTAPIDAAIGAANPRDGTSPLRGAAENIALNAVLPSVVEGSAPVVKRALARRRRPAAAPEPVGGIEPQSAPTPSAPPPLASPPPSASDAIRIPDQLPMSARSESHNVRSGAKKREKDLTAEPTDALVSRLMQLNVRLEKNQRLFSEEGPGGWTRQDDDMGTAVSGSTGHWTQPHINRDFRALVDIQDELKRRGIDVDAELERVAEREGLAKDEPVQYAEAIDMGTPFGRADLRPISTIAGAGTGSVVGASLDDEDRLRGAAMGAALGGTLGALSPSAFRAGRTTRPRSRDGLSVREWEDRATESFVDVLPAARGLKAKEVPDGDFLVPRERLDEGAADRAAFPVTANHLADHASTKGISVAESAKTLRDAGYSVTREMEDEAHGLVMRQEHLTGDDIRGRYGETFDDQRNRMIEETRREAAKRRSHLSPRIGAVGDIGRMEGREFSREGLEAWAKETKEKLGLETFNVFHRASTDDILLSDIAVPRSARKQGIGTEAMRQLVRYADEHGKRIILTPALRDPRHGTTSRSRLVDFYKRFGFVENKGRKKDFTIMEGMYREPSHLKNRPGFVSLSPKRVAPQPYMADPAVQAIRGSVRGGIGSSLPKTSISDIAHKTYTRIVDELHPLREFGRKVGKTERLSHEASRAQGWQGAAEARLYQELRPVLHAAKGHEDGTIALAKAERIIELADAGKATDPVQLANAQATVIALGRVPEVRGAVDQLRAYYRSLLDHKLANGVISQEQYNAIIQKGQAYVPLLPSEIAEASTPGAGGGKLVNRGTGVRRMSDNLNTADTVDPFEQAVLDTYEAERTVSKQRVTNVVSEIIRTNRRAADPFIRKVSPKFIAMSDDGKPILKAPHSKDGVVITVNEQGKKHYYEITDPELAKTWGAFDRRSQSVFVKVLRPFKNTLRTGVTLLPDFAIANAIRDNAQASLQQAFPIRSALGGAVAGAGVGAATSDDKTEGAIQGAAIGLGAGAMLPQVARTLDAMRSFIAKDADYMEWLREGGGGFSEFYARPRDAARMLTRLRHDSKVWNTVRLVNPMEFGRMVEEATRVGRYKALRKAKAPKAEASHASRDVSLDFATLGRDTKGIAGVTAFFNAKVQGWDKLARLLRNPKTWAVGAATITAPTVAMWDINKDNPEYWERPQWERNLFWLIPREGGGFYRVPKPFEVGYVFASLPERILDYMHERDPETLKFALRDMLSTTTEGTMPIPTAIEPLIENAVNFDFFRNRPVVPQGLGRLPDELQYDDRTSSVAVGIGKTTGLSPLQVENTIRGYTGSAGSLALSATDRLARASGLDKRPLSPQGRTPVVGRFVTREGETSDAEQTIYRRSERAERAWAGAKELADRGDREALVKYVEKYGNDLAARDDLKSFRDQLVELSKAERALLVAPGLSDEERRGVVAFVNEKQRRLAAQARRALAPRGPQSQARAGSTP